LELALPDTKHPEKWERVVHQASRILFLEQIKPCVEINFIPELATSVLSLPCYDPDIEREFRALLLERSAVNVPLEWATEEAIFRIFELAKLIPSYIIIHNSEVGIRSRLEEIAVLCKSLIANPNMRTRHFSIKQFETLYASKNEVVVELRGSTLDTVSAETRGNLAEALGNMSQILASLITEFSRE
jgi:hypothetical protein